MKDIRKIVRPNILQLTAYSTARDEGSCSESINVWLDANESPYGLERINRYPDPHQTELKHVISEITDMPADCIFVGNGSDEAIDLMYRIFCRPGIDNAIAIAPTYGMYGVAAEINDIAYRQVPLNDDFTIDAEALLKTADENSRLLWICSPNNPTGNAFDYEQLREIALRFYGIVVIDEAYFHYSNRGNALDLLRELDNVVVLRTLSKAYGLASIRVGFAFASPFIIDLMDKVKYPYNVNALSQQKAIDAISRQDDLMRHVTEAVHERKRISDALRQIPCIINVYSSDANFILIKATDGQGTELYDFLKTRGILVRNRSNVNGCRDCLRLTIGTPQENDKLIKAIAEFK